jgi:membrane protease YdiL (CAAX protease family)
VALLVGYAISPLDLIPDFIPVLGYFDDLILLPLGILLAHRLIPNQVLQECREKARTENRRLKPNGWQVNAIKLLGLLVILLLLRAIVLAFLPAELRRSIGVRYLSLGLVYLVLGGELVLAARERLFREKVGLVAPRVWLKIALLMAIPLALIAGGVALYRGGIIAPASLGNEWPERILFIIGLAVAAPLAEEIIYRGLLLGLLLTWSKYLSPDPRWPPQYLAIGLTALVFALAHLGSSPLFLPVLFVGGVLYGWARWRTGSIWPAVAGHATWNGVLATSQLILWVQ